MGEFTITYTRKDGGKCVLRGLTKNELAYWRRMLAEEYPDMVVTPNEVR